MMRNIIRSILLFVLFFVSAVAKCQTEKKTWLIGGTGYVYVYKLESNLFGWEKYTVNQLRTILDLNIGYCIVNNFFSGIRTSINGISTKIKENTPLENYTELSAGPFSRVYFMNNGRHYNFFMDVNYQFGLAKKYLDHNGQINKLEVSSGIELFENTSIGIEILIGYRYKKILTENSINWTRSQNTGPFLKINFQFHLLNQ